MRHARFSCRRRCCHCCIGVVTVGVLVMVHRLYGAEKDTELHYAIKSSHKDCTTLSSQATGIEIPLLGDAERGMWFRDVSVSSTLSNAEQGEQYTAP